MHVCRSLSSWGVSHRNGMYERAPGASAGLPLPPRRCNADATRGWWARQGLIRAAAGVRATFDSCFPARKTKKCRESSRAPILPHQGSRSIRGLALKGWSGQCWQPLSRCHGDNEVLAPGPGGNGYGPACNVVTTSPSAPQERRPGASLEGISRHQTGDHTQL